MDFNSTFEDFRATYYEAIDKVTALRQSAEEIKESMDSIISACEDIENEL